jgi:hypothetical protein
MLHLAGDYPTEQSLKDRERDMGAIPSQREMAVERPH